MSLYFSFIFNAVSATFVIIEHIIARINVQNDGFCIIMLNGRGWRHSVKTLQKDDRGRVGFKTAAHALQVIHRRQAHVASSNSQTE